MYSARYHARTTTAIASNATAYNNVHRRMQRFHEMIGD